MEQNNLIAQAEAALDGVTEGVVSCLEGPVAAYRSMSEAVQHNLAVPVNLFAATKAASALAWCRAGVPALIARIRELEGERDAFRAVLEGAQYGDLDGIAKNTREQSFALGEAVMGFTIQLRTRAEALTAQVEAMRVSAMKAMTIANGALDPTATEKTFRRDLVQIREELRGALWPAALTTENQTNG